VTLLPGYVEVRDKGVLKKKIPTNNRSFDDVCSDLERYFRDVGKKLPPGVIKEALQKIGVPQVKMIISGDETPEEPQAEVVKEISTSIEVRRKTRRKPKSTKSTSRLEPTAPDVAEEEPKGVISGMEYRDVEEALSAVESLSDSFLASKPRQASRSVSEKGRIKIEVEGSEEIVGGPQFRTAVQERVSSTGVGVRTRDIASLTVEQSGTRKEAAQSPTRAPKVTVVAKALILGEEGVGKSSLVSRAGLKPLESETEAEKKPYVSEKMIELDNYRVKLQVWSFDVASSSRVTRKAFYDNAGIVIIVYSTSDRWSFESIDFWLKESTSATAAHPPFVIVGNKTDIRANAPLIDRDAPVSQEEGLKLAQDIAAKLGSSEKLHPVGFIETSCLTGQGVEDLFRLVAELFVKSMDRRKA
jgi:Ras-related protein Rab-23